MNQAAATRGISKKLVADLEAAVVEFETLIREEAGDRSALDAILAAWLPEARGEFELRRKQAAYRAMSQLKGSSADVLLATVFIAPNADDPERLDLVWVLGLIGLQRLWPGATIKLASRRVAANHADPAEVEESIRQPRSLSGKFVDDFADLRLKKFCSSPAPKLTVHHAAEMVQYVLAGDGFGPSSATDLVVGELNLSELPRRVERRNDTLPIQRFVSAEITTPARELIFDAFAHRDLQSGQPKLSIYDTSFEGLASVNDRARDIDRIDLQETIAEINQDDIAIESIDCIRNCSTWSVTR